MVATIAIVNVQTKLFVHVQLKGLTKTFRRFQNINFENKRNTFKKGALPIDEKNVEIKHRAENTLKNR